MTQMESQQPRESDVQKTARVHLQASAQLLPMHASQCMTAYRCAVQAMLTAFWFLDYCPLHSYHFNYSRNAYKWCAVIG